MKFLCLGLAPCVVLCLGAGAASARSVCTVDGQHINLDNGASTANLTGVVKCVDDGTGKLAREMPYRNGQLHGTVKFVGWDGKTTLTEYQAGKKHGLAQTYAAAGWLESDTRYENDVEVGPARGFYQSGKVKRDTVFPKDKSAQAAPIVSEYTEDGKLTALRIGNGGRIGTPFTPYGTFSGSVTLHHANGAPRDVLPFKQGLLEGRVERYRAEGPLLAEEAWQGGMLNGLARGFQDDGKTPSREARFRQGVYDGVESEFFAGMKQLRAEREWRDGVLVREKRYFQNGAVERETARQGEGFAENVFWDNGKPRSAATQTARNPGAKQHKREAGWFEPRVRETPAYSAAEDYWPARQFDGTVTKYFMNGGRESETTFKRGKREGLAKTWHDNGEPATEARYENDVLVAMKEYDKAGKLVRDDEFFPDGSRKRKGAGQ